MQLKAGSPFHRSEAGCIAGVLMQQGVTTRKCANCPVGEAPLMLQRSAIPDETRFSRCPKAIAQKKLCFFDRNQVIRRTLFTLIKNQQMAPVTVFHSLNRREFNAQSLKLFKFCSLEPDNSGTFVSSPPYAALGFSERKGKGSHRKRGETENRPPDLTVRIHFQRSPARLSGSLS
jgi:hypothetical protein